jgi:hypothetical protein
MKRDPIMIDAEDGRIQVRRKSLFPALRELVARITPENRYDETPSGPERGKESVER